MRTLIVSDLHLGSVSRADVLQAPEPRAQLLEALQGADRLVLLGDTLELRHGPAGAAMRAAEPVLREIGQAMAGREILLVAGNHDHALVDPWVRRRVQDAAAEPLGLEQRIAPAEASELAEAIAVWMAPAHLSVAHPGLWLREDVYATHGHYLDCHITVPTMERMGIAAMGAMMRKPHTELCTVQDYEALTAPIYAWIDAVAAQGATGAALNGTATVRIWRALGGESSHSPSASGNGRRPWPRELAGSLRRDALARAVRRTALRRGFPLAVAALNRAGLGPVSADISGPQLRRSALSAMGEVAQRLGLRDCHVIFGHTHRTGPLPGDDAGEWRVAEQVALMNTGSWTHDTGWLGTGPGGRGGREPSLSPYWPGGCVTVEDDGPPLLRRLLGADLREQITQAPA